MPKRVLVTEALAQPGLDILQRCAEVTVCLNPTHEELLGMVGDYEALVVRSATKVTADVLCAGTRLLVVGPPAFMTHSSPSFSMTGPQW